MTTRTFLPVSPVDLDLSQPLSEDILLLDRLLREVLCQHDGAPLLKLVKPMPVLQE